MAGTNHEATTKIATQAIANYDEATGRLHSAQITASAPPSVIEILGKIDTDLGELRSKLATLGLDADAKNLEGIIASLKQAAVTAPLKRKRSCFFGHYWSAWIHTATVGRTISDKNYDKHTVYNMLLQRECINCGDRGVKETLLVDPR